MHGQLLGDLIAREPTAGTLAIAQQQDLGMADLLHRSVTISCDVGQPLSLFGGAASLLGGVLVWPRHPRLAPALVLVGTLVGLLAAGWTIALPVLGVAVMALAIRDAGRPATGPDPEVSGR